MAETYLTGIAKIEIGEIAVDGGAATSFESVGQIYKDTARMEQAEGESFEHEVEDVDDPVVIVPTKGRSTVEWAVIDFTPANLVKILGGAVTGTAPNDKWEAPDTAVIIEKSVKITPKSGKPVTLPRVSLRARINYALSKSGIGQVIISGTVLQPTKTGVKSIIYG
jgi:hypothetical protein